MNMHHGYMHHGCMHHGYMHHLYIHHIMDTCIMDTSAWVTRPERPKDEIKEARRAKRRPEGPQTRSWGPKGQNGARRAPKLLVHIYDTQLKYFTNRISWKCIECML